MRGRFLYVPALLVALGAAMNFTAGEAQAQQERRDGTQFRGKIVRVGATGNLFIVRGEGGKEVTFYGGDRTTYRLGDRDARFQDLREGMVISGYYDVTGDRNVVRSLTLANDAAPRDSASDRDPASGGTARGTILKAASDPNHLIVKTSDGKEMILHLDSRQEANFTFEMREGKRMLTGMTFGAVGKEPERRSDSGPIRGEVVRTEGDDRVIVRTAEGKEVIFYADPKSTYEFEGRAIKFGDLKRGVYVDVDYDVRDSRHFARRIIGRPRR